MPTWSIPATSRSLHVKKSELCPLNPVSLSLKRLREVKGFVDARSSEPCVVNREAQS